MAVSGFVSNLNDDDKASYFTKLKQLGFFNERDDPFLTDELETKVLDDQWSTSLELWPTVEFGNVYVYLIDCPGYSHQSLKAYKSLDAYSYFANGWVHQLYVRQSSTGHSIVKGHIIGSQDVSDVAYTAWVGFNNEDGSIVTGHCSCMTGENAHGICSHMTAIVFHVEAAPHLSCSKASTCLLCPYHQETHTQPQDYTKKYSVVVYPEPTTQDGATSVSPEAPVLKQPNVAHSCKFCLMAFSSSTFLEDHTKSQHHEEYSKSIKEKSIEKLETIREVGSDDARTKDGNQTSIENNDDDTCKLCGVTFSAPHFLERHMHTQHRAYMREMKEEKEKATNSTVKKQTSSSPQFDWLHCKACSAVFRSRRLLDRHVVKQHGEDKPKAKARPRRSPGKVHSVNQQEKTATNGKTKKPFKCDQCQKIFLYASKLRKHMKSHTRELLFKCHKCDMRFRYKYGLDRHSLRAHSKERPFQCDKCERSFAMNYQLLEHTRSHIPNKNELQSSSIPDEINGGNSSQVAVAINDSSTKQVEISPQSEMPLKSEECGEDIQNDDDKKVDNMATDTDENRFKCDVCEKVFLSELILRAHFTIHTGERPYKCNVCQKTFRLSGDLKRHATTHTGERPFKCVICQKTFKRKKDAKEHATIHTERSLTCDVCGKTVQGKRGLTLHMLLHTREVKSFKCEDCGKIFSIKRYFEAHVRKHTRSKPMETGEAAEKVSKRNNLPKEPAHKNERVFQCDLCGKIFKRHRNLKRHVMRHSEEKPCKCETCEMSFSTPYILKRHTAMKHRANFLHKCEFCQMGFEKKERYLSHVAKHTGVKPYKCGECDKAFLSRRSHKLHEMTHSKERPFKCDQCRKSFVLQSYLTSHLRIHTGVRPFKCDKCDMSFYRSSNLRRHHKRWHEANNGKIYKCIECELTFPNTYARRAHMYEHSVKPREKGTKNVPVQHGEKAGRHECHVCQKTFSCYFLLRAHMPKHTGEYHFTCEYCSKGFITKAGLIIHTRTHTGEKPFICSQCGKAFAQSVSLQFHMMKHAGKNPYKRGTCTDCGRVFSSLTNLKRHVNAVHHGEKMHSCDLCGRSFATKGTLVVHLRSHKKEKPFKCEHCVQSFSEKRSLRKHIAAKHHEVNAAPATDSHQQSIEVNPTGCIVVALTSLDSKELSKVVVYECDVKNESQ